MTAREPGARLVLTVGPTVRPRATALRASRPAPTITVGLEVLVQLVMAAMATDPVRTGRGRAFGVDRHGAVEGRPGVARRGHGRRAEAGVLATSTGSAATNAGGSLAGKDSCDASSTSRDDRGTRARRVARSCRSGTCSGSSP